MAAKKQFVCSNCKAIYPKWVGQCSQCNEWGTVEEQDKPVTGGQTATALKPNASARLAQATTGNTPKKITQVKAQDTKERLKTGIQEFDRVLGGGIIDGGVILLAGQPGSGKSTLLGSTSKGVADQGKTVLYISGEENETQIASRHERIGSVSENIYILSESNADNAVQSVYDLRPDLLIVDSVQTLLSSRSESKTGSPSQVVEVASEFTNIAKQLNIPTILIGHVTKADSIAGPRVVEHLVDVVLILEASQDTPLRLLRAAKNRFGSTEEVGLFQHEDNGLQEISDPSGFFTDSHNEDISGYATSITVEGIRAIPMELTALVTPSPLPNPRKLTHGLEHSRSLMVQAILEKYAALKIGDKDVYVSTTGGITVRDSSLDLALAAALISSYYDIPPVRNSVYIGEISLTGEVRPARFAERRIREARRLGFTVFGHEEIPSVRHLISAVKKDLK